MTYEADPLRDHFTRGARQLLDRAYAHPGTWQGTRLAAPDAAALRFCLTRGINPLGPDNVSAAGGRRGGLNARSRWMRAFVRCLYEQHLWWAGTHGSANAWRGDRRLAKYGGRGLQIEVGRAVPARGLIPAGRAVRVRVVSQARAAAMRKAAADRTWTDSGEAGERWSDPSLRDWA